MHSWVHAASKNVYSSCLVVWLVHPNTQLEMAHSHGERKGNGLCSGWHTSTSCFYGHDCITVKVCRQKERTFTLTPKEVFQSFFGNNNSKIWQFSGHLLLKRRSCLVNLLQSVQSFCLAWEKCYSEIVFSQILVKFQFKNKHRRKTCKKKEERKGKSANSCCQLEFPNAELPDLADQSSNSSIRPRSPAPKQKQPQRFPRMTAVLHNGTTGL